MVDISGKAESARFAIATGRVTMAPETAALVTSGDIEKGDVLGIARLAAITGLKRTWELIPLCHPLRITGVEVDLRVESGLEEDDKSAVVVEVEVRAFDRTGVEMEALAAVTVAALTVYDMCKAVDRDMTIEDVRLESKGGGRTGTWRRIETPDAPQTGG